MTELKPLSAREAGVSAREAGVSAPPTLAHAPTSAAVTPRNITHRRILLTSGLAISLVIVSLVSAGTGQLHISPGEVISTILRPLGFNLGSVDAINQSALWSIRFPRLLMAIVVGAALAASGTLMQAVFANPLAEPSVVGVSAGAALGAAVSIVLGLSFFGPWTIAATAFVGGLITTLFVYLASRSHGKTEVITLILTGVAVNAFAGALLAFLTFLGTAASREQIIFWQLGSLNGARWEQLAIVAPLVGVGLLGAFFLARTLDLFSLGERGARHLGVNVELVRVVVVVIVAVLVSAAVAFAGIIAFVGLVIPHLMRMIIGPAHGPLLLTSTLGGALLLSLADLVARTAIPMADLPIGMLTSLVGGPFFFWILRRARRTSGGWA